MSEETAATAEASQPSLTTDAPPPAASLSEPPSPPVSPSAPLAEQFDGKTFTFSLLGALTDLNFTVTPDVQDATFAVMCCVAITHDGDIATALSKPENVRNFDEAQEAMRARRFALDSLGYKTN